MALLTLFVVILLFNLGTNGDECMPADLGCQMFDSPPAMKRSWVWDCSADGSWQTTTYDGVTDCSGDGEVTVGASSPMEEDLDYGTCGDPCDEYIFANIEVYYSNDTTDQCTGDYTVAMTMASYGTTGECDDGETNTCTSSTSFGKQLYSDNACQTADGDYFVFSVGGCTAFQTDEDTIYMKATSIECVGNSGDKCMPADLGCQMFDYPAVMKSSWVWDCSADGSWQTTTYDNVTDCSGDGEVSVGVTSPMEEDLDYGTCGDPCNEYIFANIEVYTTDQCIGDYMNAMTMASYGTTGECDDGETNTCPSSTSIGIQLYNDNACETADGDDFVVTVGGCTAFPTDESTLYMKATSIECVDNPTRDPSMDPTMDPTIDSVSLSSQMKLMIVLLLGVMSTLFGN